MNAPATAETARSVSEGSEVRTGRLEGEDDWEVTSVLIRKTVGEEKAEEQAYEIVEKIESRPRFRGRSAESASIHRPPTGGLQGPGKSLSSRAAQAQP
ncbi:hypothetical protein AB7C87_23865 [Natrarchaeobius sp. A-rgal3]|uniref:hypothetical protein n=1 Tax=Natrarchaeobius versutus TaxID=1679078 RepID=UPI003510568D